MDEGARGPLPSPLGSGRGRVGSLSTVRGVAAAACGSAPVDSAPTSARRSSTAAGSPVSGGLSDGLAGSAGGAAGGVPPGRLGVTAGARGPVRRSSDAGGDGTAPEGALPETRGSGGALPGVPRTGQEGRGGGSAAGPSSAGGRCFEVGTTLVSSPPPTLGSSVCGVTGPPTRLMPIMIE